MADQGTLAECIESYFYQSEQLPTHIQLVSTEAGAAGLMLQRLPQTTVQEAQADSDWELVHALAASLTELVGAGGFRGDIQRLGGEPGGRYTQNFSSV